MFLVGFCLCVDELGQTVGRGTFGKVVECKDLKRYVEKMFFCSDGKLWTKNIRIVLY